MRSLRRPIGSSPERLSTAALLVVILIVVGAIWTPGVITAQVTATPAALSCAQLLPAVQKNLSQQCSSLDRDQVCYGNTAITVQYRDEDAASSFPFTVPGNIAPLSALKSITTAPLNLERGEWGLAVLKVQTNLPGTTAGQAVTFVLYGDTSLTNATVASGATGAATVAPACTATTTRQTFLRTAPGPNEQQVVLLPPNATANVTARLANSSWVHAEYQGQTGWLFTQVLKLSCDVSSLPVNDPNQPASLPGMSAFYFSTGVGSQADCKDVPAGGLLVQSPKGQKVSFKVNGADITLGSTAIFRAQADRQMVMSVLEGQGIVTVGNVRQIVNAGQGVTLPLGTPGTGQAAAPDFALGLMVNGPPSPPRPMQTSELFLPFVCNISKAAGLTVPCTVVPPATPRPRITFTPRPQQPGQPSPTPTQATTGANCTFTVQRFAADQNPAPYDPKSRGQFCTTMRWDVEGVETVFFNGQGVIGHGSQFVCIQKPTTYTLTMNCGGQSKSVSYTLNPGNVSSVP